MVYSRQLIASAPKLKEENTLLKKQNEVLLTNLHSLYNLLLSDMGKGFEEWDEAKEYKKAIDLCTK